jgi:hypothetical protein
VDVGFDESIHIRRYLCRCCRRTVSLLPQFALPYLEPADVRQALTELGAQARYNQLRQQIMTLTECSKRTAQTAIMTACQQGCIVPADGHYCLPR